MGIPFIQGIFLGERKISAIIFSHPFIIIRHSTYDAMEALRGKVNKAIVYSEPGTCATEVVERPIEAPGPGQVLVRMYAPALNYAKVP